MTAPDWDLYAHAYWSRTTCPDCGGVIDENGRHENEPCPNDEGAES